MVAEWLVCAAADPETLAACPEDRVFVGEVLLVWPAGRCAMRRGGFAVATPPALPKAEATTAASAAGVAMLAAAEERLPRAGLLPRIQASARWGETVSNVQKRTARLAE